MGAGVAVPVCRDADDVARLLLRHHHMRLAGGSLLTIIVGETTRARHVLRAIDRELDRSVVEVVRPTSATDRWVAQLAEDPRARAALEHRLGSAALSQSSRTLHDWRRLVAQAIADDTDESAKLARALASGDVARLTAELAPDQRLSDRSLRRVTALVDRRVLPGLRISAPSKSQLGLAIDVIDPLLSHPPIPVEILTTSPTFEAWLAGPTHRSGLALEGLVRLPDIRVAAAATPAYRSLPERLLHEALERDPQTRGLFVVNAAMSVRFGRRPAEVDLLCERYRLAVEVDGWHHFRNPARYRRDRRKDLLLQEHGYRVLRVLAADVVDDAPAQAALVRATVGRARRGRTSGGGTS